MKAVHKTAISAMIANLKKMPEQDQQVRHLKAQDGWYTLNQSDSYTFKGVELFNPAGCHVLVCTNIPHPTTAFLRRNVIKKGSWDEIVEFFKNACASCGTKIGEQHRFDSSLKVESLQQGHMDPHKPLELGNIIPQCRWCNQTARDDFVFDAQGRPRAVANIRPVRRASPAVIEELKKWLLGE